MEAVVSTDAERGTQAHILRSTLAGLPADTSLAYYGYEPGTSEGQETGGKDCIAQATDSPIQSWREAKRLNGQCVQLSGVLVTFTERAIVQLREIHPTNGAAVVSEACVERLKAVKELLHKLAGLEASVHDALQAMGAPITSAEFLQGMNGEQDLSSIHTCWMGVTEVKRLLDVGAVGAPGVLERLEEEKMQLHRDNHKLRVKVEAMQRQLTLLSSSDLQLQKQPASQLPGGAPAVRASAPAAGAHTDATISVKENARLRKSLEEKEELLAGLRRTVRDVCNDRYPLLAERDELRVQVADMAMVQHRLLDERDELKARVDMLESMCQDGAHARSVPVTNGSLQYGRHDDILPSGYDGHPQHLHAHYDHSPQPHYSPEQRHAGFGMVEHGETYYHQQHQHLDPMHPYDPHHQASPYDTAGRAGGSATDGAALPVDYSTGSEASVEAHLSRSEAAAIAARGHTSPYPRNIQAALEHRKRPAPLPLHGMGHVETARSSREASSRRRRGGWLWLLSSLFGFGIEPADPEPLDDDIMIV